MQRRAFVGAGAVWAAAALLRPLEAWAQDGGATPVDPALLDDLVAGNRILAREGILDGMGHISVRHPRRADRFLLARSMAPALVTTADILEYDLAADPVDARNRTSYKERFIHSEIYRARPDVMSVVHCHTASVIPFADTDVPIQQNGGRGALVKVASGGNLIAPAVFTVPLQMLAYHVAVLRGTDVDQPRNLAKSVTVE